MFLKSQSLCDKFKGGQTANYWHEWVKLTSDKGILSDIKGISIECTEIPTQHILKGHPNCGSDNRHIIEDEICKLLHKDIVRVTTKEPGQIVRHFFPPQKIWYPPTHMSTTILTWTHCSL